MLKLRLCSFTLLKRDRRAYIKTELNMLSQLQCKFTVIILHGDSPICLVLSSDFQYMWKMLEIKAAKFIVYKASLLYVDMEIFCAMDILVVFKML